MELLTMVLRDVAVSSKKGVGGCVHRRGREQGFVDEHL